MDSEWIVGELDKGESGPLPRAVYELRVTRPERTDQLNSVDYRGSTSQIAVYPEQLSGSC
jgi:hypothetical protein